MQGTLDMLVQRTGEQGQGNVLFVQNNFYYDAFFLKAIGEILVGPLLASTLTYISQFSTVVVRVDGVPLQTEVVSTCVSEKTRLVFSHTPFQPFGVSYSGATYKYTVIDTTGQRAAAAGKFTTNAFMP